MAGDSKEVARAHLADAGVEELPADWDVVTLGDLFTEDRGIAVGVMYPGDHDPDGVPLIKAGDLNGSIINPQPDFRISRDKHHEYRRTALEGGELLMTLVGNVGQCAVVPPRMAGWNTARAVAVMRLADSSDTHFVQQCLLSRPLQHLMDVWCNTTVQATLNLKEIRQLPLPWPPKQSRDAIAAFGKALDDKIECNRRMNATLEAMARALFQSWFVDFDPVRAKVDGRTPAHLDPATAALFPDSFQESGDGHIPKGWTAQRLPDAIEVNPRRTLKSGTIAPYLDMKNLPTQGHSAEEVIDREFNSGTKFRNGDTLLARITPCLENGKTGYVDFLEDGQVGWGSTEYIVLAPKSPLPPQFGYLLARSDALRAHAIQNMTGTSGRQRVPAECFSTFWLAVATPEIARRFDELTAPLMAKIKSNSTESRTLAALRDALLPRLLSGELRVAGG